VRILIRNDKSSQWTVAESAAYGAEIELQDLLARSPSLIPLHEIREGASPLIVAVREFGLPGSGNTDILCFTADGSIAVIECKLAANPESKRKVIGQILEYGAYLWGMAYEEVDQTVHRLAGKDLVDLVRASVGNADWDEAGFRDTVSKSLETGAFALVVAVDRINEELSRTIRFLNGCGNPAFSFHALELLRFSAGGSDILVPGLHGPSLQNVPGPPIARRRWTKEEFFQAIRKKLPPESVQLIEDFYEWSEEVADRVWLGAGAKIGTFTFHYLKDGKTVSVFTVDTDGYLQLNYGWLANQVETHILEEFHQSIHNIPTLRGMSTTSKWPYVKIVDVFLNQPDATDKFKETVTKLGDKVRS